MKMPEASGMSQGAHAAAVPRVESRKGHAAMAVFPLLVAGSFSLGGLVADKIDPVALTTLRFVIATAVVGGAALATGQLSRASLRAPWRYFVMGGLYVVYFVMMFEALRVATPLSLSAVFTLTPAFSAVIGWLWLRQRITRRMALALAIGAAGAIWVVFRGDIRELLAFRIGHGERLLLIGCIFHAAYPAAARRLSHGEPPLASLTGVLLAGTVLLALWGWRAIGATDWLALPALVWLVVLYIAVVSGAVTFFLVQYAALRLPGAKVMAYTYLTPVWVAGLEVALGHGVPSVSVAAGAVLTLAALVLLLKDEG